MKKNEDGAKNVGCMDDIFAEKFVNNSEGEYTRKDGLSDAGLAHFQQHYPSEIISKEDVFYYVYGLLHSPNYRARYAANLSKELPRMPCVNTAKDFWHFSQAGRDLAQLHVHYETVAKYPVTLDCGKRTLSQLNDQEYRVIKMKRPKIKVDGKSVNDNSTIIYNNYITVRDIPLAAYDYVVNDKAAIEWVIDRQTI